MRVLLVHNRYQLKGGEDSVFQAEHALLQGAGIDVGIYDVSNDAIGGLGSQVRTLATVAYSAQSRRKVEAVIRQHRPDIVHVHNFFPLITPSIFHACAAAGLPVVWSIHNFRVTCANGLLFRNGAPCEKCLGKSPLPGILHRCYRNSLPASLGVAGMIGINRMLGTWRHKVTRFIALNDFGKAKLIASGLPGEKIRVKPNFVVDPGMSVEQGEAPRGGVLFVGRLSHEKGLASVITAWRDLSIPLTIIGEGPEEERLRAMAGPSIRFLGWQEPDSVRRHMREAAGMIVPSLWYENFPMTIVEAFAVGTPVFASRLGAMPYLIRDGIDGFLFDPGDSVDIADVVNTVFKTPARLADASRFARQSYELNLTPEANIALLLSIYEGAIAEMSAEAVN